MREARVFFIIPAYNAEKYIGACLDSLIAQTYQDWEVLCLDDGSRDNTFKILSEYAEKDERIHVFTHQNSGVCKTRNELLEKLKSGEYNIRDEDFIMFVDADDIVHPQTLEITLGFAEKTGADVVEFKHKRFPAEEKKIDFTHIDKKSVTHHALRGVKELLINRKESGQWYSCWNKILSFGKVKNIRFNEKLSYEDDVFYNMQVNINCQHKVILNAILYYWRNNPESLTGNVNFSKYIHCAVERIDSCQKYFLQGELLPNHLRADFIRDLTLDAYRMLIKKLLKNCHDKELRQSLFPFVSGRLKEYVREGVLNPSVLPLTKRWVFNCCLAGKYKEAKIAIIIAYFF